MLILDTIASPSVAGRARGPGIAIPYLHRVEEHCPESLATYYLQGLESRIKTKREAVDGARAGPCPGRRPGGVVLCWVGCPADFRCGKYGLTVPGGFL
ncbi:MAG: hypothetical protein Kow00128_07300 [Deltaproteobacteria bacterium]